MRSRAATFLGLLGLSLVLVAGPGAAAPASAATSADCKRGHVCLFDGKRYTGALKTVGCTNGAKKLGANWDNRVSSVINRCGKPLHLVDVPPSGTGSVKTGFVGRNGTLIAGSTVRPDRPIRPGQWVRDLGGSQGMNNRADVVRVG